MGVFDRTDHLTGHEQVVFCQDPQSGLREIIAIWSTALGPALGGTRFKAYADEDAAYWAAELDREIAPGLFGENLRISGIDVSGAEIGERWRVGDGPDAVELEVTMPRTPCMTFARWVGGPEARGWVKRFADERRLGAYLRVTRTGTVEAGDEVRVLSSPADAPTVAEVFRPM